MVGVSPVALPLGSAFAPVFSGAVPVLAFPPAPRLPLQASVAAVLGTYLLFAAFLSVTAFIAARNVLGDVPWRRYAVVGPPLAAIAFLAATFEVNSFLALAAALLADAGMVARLHDVGPRLVAAITLIHAVVSVLLGAVLFGLVVILGTAPV
ncbi:MAG: hypothetical protein ABEH90_04350 [Halolamina sp.]